MFERLDDTILVDLTNLRLRSSDTTFEQDNFWILLKYTVFHQPVTVFGKQRFHHDLRQELVTAGAWANDRAFVWSEEGNIRSEISTIYCVHLHSGVATATSYRFNDLIRRLCIHQVDLISTCVYASSAHLSLFSYSAKYPESLFFLAAAALQRPIPQRLIKFITRHREPIPMQCTMSVIKNGFFDIHVIRALVLLQMMSYAGTKLEVDFPD
ncbi:hypothetical protein M3Y98_00382800 [Aphelenchoides besseyi]|nr:hypothetical protein M3Y98_00382800 [Aphelenchoides besseyi]KAI6201956.1 hypothetical protein M3Y96_00897400 [Aphelenchoides besseyi]KAI6201960.1 hypothetical protein M3Y96_00897800 [Aphelenchoides besseyi]